MKWLCFVLLLSTLHLSVFICLHLGFELLHAATAAPILSSSSTFETVSISRPNTSPNRLTSARRTSPPSTTRPSTFSSDVMPLPTIPHGTIQSKYRKSVVTLYANPCDVTHRLRCTPSAANFSSRGARPTPAGASTQIPCIPSTRRAATPKSVDARIITSSSCDTYHRTSRRCSAKPRIGYPITCPGP